MTNKRVQKLLPLSATIGVLAILWTMATMRGWISPLFLPSPAALAASTITLFGQKGFAHDILASLYRVAAAFLASLILAIPTALVMSSHPWINRVLNPVIDFIRYLPVPALVPLMILFFGIGEVAKITLLFVGTFFQLVVLIFDDLSDVPREYRDLGSTLHFTWLQTLMMKLRAILPQLYDNSRVTIGWCWSYVIIAELVASPSGIGHMIKEAQRFSNTADVFIGIITIGLIGFITDTLMKRWSPWFFPYRIMPEH